MLSDKIKELRTKKSLSQEDVADKLFCSRSLVSKWKQGKSIPFDDDIQKMAESAKRFLEVQLSKNSK